MLANGPKEIPDEAMNSIERFVIPVFEWTGTCNKVNDARRKLFPWKNISSANTTYLSCIGGARPESSWVVTSGGTQCYQSKQTLCSHHQLGGDGWRQNRLNELYTVTLPKASKSCHKLISCGCKSGCKKCCTCLRLLFIVLASAFVN